MCERSYSDASRGLGVGVPPHIRDALERARLTAEPQPHKSLSSSFQRSNNSVVPRGHTESNSPNNQSLTSTASSPSYESNIVSHVANKEKQVQNLTAYINDTLRILNKQHAYLSATYLDPAVGLEVEILVKDKRSSLSPISDADEIKAALVASNLAVDQLMRDNLDLRRQVNESKQTNYRLEQERNSLHLALRRYKSCGKTSNEATKGRVGASTTLL